MTFFIDESIRFITKNLDDILLVALGLLIFIAIKYQFNMNGKKTTKSNDPPKVVKEIVIESMDIKDKLKDKFEKYEKIVENSVSNFCKSTKGKSHRIEEKCKKQKDTTCKTLSCCVLAMKKGEKKGQCLAGTKLGPTYHTDENGNDVNFDYYYYQNKCYGSGCPE